MSDSGSKVLAVEGDGIPLRVLLVEDSRAEATLLVRTLEQGGFDPQWQRVMLLEELPVALESQEWDVILCDYGLPGYTALDALEVITTAAPQIPCIVVTGMVGEEVAVACMRAGAQDLMLKDQLHRLVPAIRRELQQAGVRRERHRARRELEITHRFLMIANRHTEQAPLLQEWTDALGKITGVSAVGIRLLEQQGQIGYQAHQGFSKQFVELEGPLSLDHPCMCSRVIRGDIAPVPLRVTTGGSCWTSNFSEQLTSAVVPFNDLRGGCVEAGFESMALVPIIIGQQVAGLIHLADLRPGLVDRELVSQMEVLAIQLGTALGRVRALAELQEKEHLYRTLVELSPDAVLVADQSHRIVTANERAARMYGHDGPTQLVGASLDELLKGLDPGEGDIKQDLLDAGSKGAEYLQGRPDGSTFPAELHASMMHHDDARSGTVVSVRDISKRREMQAQLAQADRLASVGMLAAGVAHEINNPLTYVLQNLDWLIDGLEDREGPEGEHSVASLMQAAREATDGANRVRNIVRDLRTFSRVEGYSVEQVDVNEVLELASTMARGELRFRARLVQRLSDVPPVLANEGRLAQVFLNLLINAAQSMEDGEVEDNEIELRSWTEGDEVLVSVRDTGAGISQENRDKLFTPFFTTREPGVGSGLGLAICHSLITRFQGRIEVQSEVGQGSTFTVRLPTAEQDEKEEDIPAATEAVSAGSQSSSGRVLVIDDEPCLLSSMGRLLRQHEVVKAASGGEARRILEEDRRFDVILCDMMMPGITGMDLYQWLHELDEDLAARVVFTTGGPDNANLEQFLDSVPNPRLFKPFETSALLEIVQKLIIKDGP